MNPSTKHDKPGGAKLSTAPSSVPPGQQRGPPLQPSAEPAEERNLHAAQQRPRAQTQSAADLASSLTSDMKESASTASRAIKEQASQFASDVGHELGKTAEEQKARGVDAIQCFARAMTSAAAELENQSPQVAEYVRDAAQKVAGLSEKIAQRDVNELVRAATELARSQPLLFIGGAVAIGFAVSRFLMSSAKAVPDQHPPGRAAHT
jgi:ElaB/YqjD/DUF883 family membrane-anchored ribosome-binding protein